MGWYGMIWYGMVWYGRGEGGERRGEEGRGWKLSSYLHRCEVLLCSCASWFSVLTSARFFVGSRLSWHGSQVSKSQCSQVSLSSDAWNARPHPPSHTRWESHQMGARRERERVQEVCCSLWSLGVVDPDLAVIVRLEPCHALCAVIFPAAAVRFAS